MRCTCNADKRVRFSPAAVYRVPGPVAGRLSPKQQTGVRFFRYSYISVLWSRSRFDSGHRKVDCSSTAEPQIVDLMMRVRLPPFQTESSGRIRVSPWYLITALPSTWISSSSIISPIFCPSIFRICLFCRNHVTPKKNDESRREIFEKKLILLI